MRRAKIVCTLGPAVESPEKVRQLIAAGMNMARLNLSHGGYEEHQARLDMVRAAAKEQGQAVAILVDLQGPKIRLARFAHGPHELARGDIFTITTDEVEGTKERVGTTYKGLPGDCKAGDRILIDDGKVTVDQIQSELAKFRYRSGGQFTTPIVIRTPYGGGIRGSHYHSQSTEAFFAHTPGLKVVIPATPYDAKGLLTSALRNPDPVLFLEPKKIYRTVRGEVPDEDYTVPIGKAHIAREGDDVTVFAYGAMLHVAMEAAELAAAKGIKVEVVDLRTIVPFDIETIMSCVKKTGKVVILYEACKTCGFGAEIAAQIAERGLLHLEAPIVRVAGFDVPFPYALEEEYMPNANRVLNAIEKVHNF